MVKKSNIVPFFEFFFRVSGGGAARNWRVSDRTTLHPPLSSFHPPTSWHLIFCDQTTSFLSSTLHPPPSTLLIFWTERYSSSLIPTRGGGGGIKKKFPGVRKKTRPLEEVKKRLRLLLVQEIPTVKKICRQKKYGAIYHLCFSKFVQISFFFSYMLDASRYFVHLPLVHIYQINQKILSQEKVHTHRVIL